MSTPAPLSNSPPPAWPHLGSRIADWEKLAVLTTPTGQRREVFEGRTETLTHFECHITTLNPGEAPHPPHRHPDEELILVKEGTLEATINGKHARSGPGSIFFFAANDEHGVRNVGPTTASYHVFRFSTPLTSRAAP